MKRYDLCIDLPATIKDPRKYLEKKIPNCNVVVYFEIQTIMGMDKHVNRLQTPSEKNNCELCGAEYETYPIILDCNPLSISAFLEDELKDDGDFRNICKKCREKEEKK